MEHSPRIVLQALQSVKGGQMVQSLSARYGTASRFVWPAWERNKNQVEGEVETLIDRLMERVQKELK